VKIISFEFVTANNTNYQVIILYVMVVVLLYISVNVLNCVFPTNCPSVCLKW